MTLTMSPSLTRFMGPRVTSPVTVYGIRSDIRSCLLRLSLMRFGILHDFVDLRHGGAGHRSQPMTVPSLYVDGEWLYAPSRQEVEQALIRHDLIQSFG